MERLRPLKVVVTGATGLVGSHLVKVLREGNHLVRTVSRGKAGDYRWNPERGEIERGMLEDVDAVIHLAGEPIAQRWTRRARGRILESRVKGTGMLVDSILEMEKKPSVFVTISGVNAYGAVRREPVSEESPSGEGFLAEVCREWEAASEPLEKEGVRRVIFRSGMVLSREGGALGKMLPFYRFGLGGPIGMGKRWNTSERDSRCLLETTLFANPLAKSETGCRGVFETPFFALAVLELSGLAFLGMIGDSRFSGTWQPFARKPTLSFSAIDAGFLARSNFLTGLLLLVQLSDAGQEAIAKD